MNKLLVGLIGAGIQRSLTPAMHEEEARCQGLALHYQLIDLDAAGVGVGVIVLAGAGGERWADRHVGATVDAIARMDLRKGDRVYLSPLQVEPGSRFQAAFQDLGTLCLAEIDAQL